MQVADYSRAMQRMPLHSDVSRTKMLPTVADLRKIIVSAIANKAMWPQCRFILFGHLGDLYGSHTGPLILQGVAPGAARTSGEEFIGVCLTEAVSTITLLFAQTTEAMRSATPDAIARALLVSIDNLLAPDSKSLIDQEWFSMGLAKGGVRPRLLLASTLGGRALQQAIRRAGRALHRCPPDRREGSGNPPRQLLSVLAT